MNICYHFNKQICGFPLLKHKSLDCEVSMSRTNVCVFDLSGEFIMWLLQSYMVRHMVIGKLRTIVTLLKFSLVMLHMSCMSTYVKISSTYLTHIYIYHNLGPCPHNILCDKNTMAGCLQGKGNKKDYNSKLGTYWVMKEAQFILPCKVQSWYMSLNYVSSPSSWLPGWLLMKHTT